MNIAVAGRPLEKIVYNSKTYIAVDYYSESSYKIPVEDESPFGEIERQLWPCTPFQVHVKSNQAVSDHFVVIVRLDGLEVAKGCIAKSDESILFQGIQGRLGCNLDLKELCFSPPRPRKKASPNSYDPADKVSLERQAELGSIIIEIHKANLIGTENTYIGPHMVSFSNANKEVGTLLTLFPLWYCIEYHRGDLQDCRSASVTAASRCIIRY